MAKDPARRQQTVAAFWMDVVDALETTKPGDN